MVILGLGTNQGDMLANLRLALQYIKKIPRLTIARISPVYVSDALLPENAPAEWNKPYLNLALRCETDLSPYDLLAQTKNIEKQIGRVKQAEWGPRIIDIDLLAWDDLIQYDEKLHIPHEHLHQRPFALWPLADVAPHWIYPLPGMLHGKTAAEIVLPWGSRFDGQAPFHTRQIAQRIETPQLVGIANVTPDSFSDGGQLTELSAIQQHVLHLLQTGAEIIDVGAEATNPRATAISADEEWLRLQPALEVIQDAVRDYFIKPKISVDTRHASTAEKVLQRGVDWINDVSGLHDAAMCRVISHNQCDAVFMHHLGIPVDKTLFLPREKNVVDAVLHWAEQRLTEITRQGIAVERLIFDAGIGFGKTAEQNLELIAHIDTFKQLGVRIMIGHSRKLFLGQFTHKEFAERDIETVILSLAMMNKQVDYLRVHNPEMHARVFKVAAAV